MARCTPGSTHRLKEQEAYFRQIPWCRDLINSLQDHIITSIDSRNPKSSGEDNLFAKTLQTDPTVPSAIALYRMPASVSDEQWWENKQSDLPIIPEVKVLFAIGEGLNGYPNVLHGGMTAALFDEVPGILLTLNKERHSEATGAPRDMINCVTANLSVKYLRQVETPGVYLVTAKVDRVEGRKMWMRSWMEDKEGVKLAESELLYMRLKEKL